MGRIQVLEKSIADKIAAGEVIERPVSVVKELLENSLDAEASFIEVEIKEGGINLIKVKDNGLGMDKKDAQIAFERHATSKISTFNDLYKLSTFGFRGEALPSIAAVSQVVVTSCQKGSSLGARVRVNGGVMEEVEEIGASHGTTMEIRNLFYNVPARRKFIKNPSYESSLIGELISKYALGHPNIRFRFISNGQVNIDTAGLNEMTDRLMYFYGQTLEKQIIPIPRTELLPNHYIEGCLVREDINRSNRNQETFFVNGRVIKSLELSKVLEEGYYTLIPKGRFPIAVLKFELPGNELDVNIHPAKLEIKINTLERFKPILIEVLKDTLWGANIAKNAFLVSSVPKTAMAKEVKEKKSIEMIEQKKSEMLRASVEEEKPIKNIYQEMPKEQLAFNEEVLKPKVSLTNQGAKNSSVWKETIYEENAPKSTYIEDYTKLSNGDKEKESLTIAETKKKYLVADKEKQHEVKVKNIDRLTLIGQLNNSFILAQNQEGLFIVDQHTCHERILYEKYMSDEEGKEVMIEELLIPITLTLSAKQDGLLINHILVFKELGFILEHFGSRTYLLRGIPVGISHVDDKEKFFIDLIDELEGSKVLTSAKIKEKIIITASCKGAIKANKALKEIEMLTLLNDLAHVQNAHTCPHGRPIIYKVTMKELYSIFQRGAFGCD